MGDRSIDNAPLKNTLLDILAEYDIPPDINLIEEIITVVADDIHEFIEKVANEDPARTFIFKENFFPTITQVFYARYGSKLPEEDDGVDEK